MAGIEENQFIPPSSATRPPLQATIDHALIFCFQRQDEISSRRLLFHRQGEEFMPQTIRDVLPYFLGTLDPDDIVTRAELRAATLEMQRLEQRLQALSSVTFERQSEEQELLAQARSVGLVAELDPRLDLRALLEAAATRAAPSTAQVDSSEFTQLQGERVRRAEQLRNLEDEAALLNTLMSESDAFSNEVHRQEARLETLELLPPLTEGAACPLCAQGIDGTHPGIEQLRETLARLRERLDGMTGDTPRLRRTLAELQQRIGEARTSIIQIDRQIDALAVTQQRVQELREGLNAQSYVRGRIDHYLHRTDSAGEGELARTQSQLDSAAARVQLLRARLSSSSGPENLTSVLNVVGDQMKEMAIRLDLEHATVSSIRIDPRRLTVVADSASGAIHLQEIGSAANWIGYHLVAYLSLHALFVERERPVPRFLVVDQPSQAFYPSDASPSADLEGLADADREAVRGIFRLLYDVAERLSPNLQVIVTDHAHLTDSWFQDSIVEEWRDGNSLVPADWIRH
jgi:hypothetical protein